MPPNLNGRPRHEHIATLINNTTIVSTWPLTLRSELQGAVYNRNTDRDRRETGRTIVAGTERPGFSCPPRAAYQRAPRHRQGEWCCPLPSKFCPNTPARASNWLHAEVSCAPPL